MSDVPNYYIPICIKVHSLPIQQGQPPIVSVSTGCETTDKATDIATDIATDKGIPRKTQFGRYTCGTTSGISGSLYASGVGKVVNPVPSNMNDIMTKMNKIQQTLESLQAQLNELQSNPLTDSKGIYRLSNSRGTVSLTEHDPSSIGFNNYTMNSRSIPGFRADEMHFPIASSSISPDEIKMAKSTDVNVSAYDPAQTTTYDNEDAPEYVQIGIRSLPGVRFPFNNTIYSNERLDVLPQETKKVCTGLFFDKSDMLPLLQFTQLDPLVEKQLALVIGKEVVPDPDHELVFEMTNTSDKPITVQHGTPLVGVSLAKSDHPMRIILNDTTNIHTKMNISSVATPCPYLNPAMVCPGMDVMDRELYSGIPYSGVPYPMNMTTETTNEGTKYTTNPAMVCPGMDDSTEVSGSYIGDKV